MMEIATDTVILQACGLDGWLQTDWHRCIFDPVPLLIGDSVFGLFVGIALWTSMYFAGGGNLSAPTVVCILCATIMFPVLPSQYVGIAWSILFIGAVSAIFQSMQKYLLNPSTA